MARIANAIHEHVLNNLSTPSAVDLSLSATSCWCVGVLAEKPEGGRCLELQARTKQNTSPED